MTEQTMRLAQLCLERAAELRLERLNANGFECPPSETALTTAFVLEEIAALLRREQASELETCPVCGIYVGGVMLCREPECPDPELRKETKA